MANHVRIGEVDDIHIRLVVFDRGRQRIGNGGLTHLGLQIVGRDLRTRDNGALLPRLFGFNAAVQEERDMRVLLGFGNMVLTQACGSEHVGKHVFGEGFRESDGGVD